MEYSPYGGVPFYMPLAPNQRRRDGKGADNNAETPLPSEWPNFSGFSLVAPYAAPYLPVPFGPRPSGANRRRSPTDLAHTRHTNSQSLNPQVSPVQVSPADGSSNPKPAVEREQGHHGGSIESALRELHHQLSSGYECLDGYYTEWTTTIAQSDVKYSSWVKRTIWRDTMDSKVMKDEGKRRRFTNMGERISKCMQQARHAADEGNSLDALESKYLEERRKRVVQQIGLSCDAITELAKQAAVDPAACEVLIKEMKEVMEKIDPGTMEELYGKAMSREDENEDRNG